MGRPLSQQAGEVPTFGPPPIPTLTPIAPMPLPPGMDDSTYGCVALSTDPQAAVDAVVVLPNAEVCDTASGVKVPTELSLLLLVTLFSAPAAGDGLIDEELEVNAVAAKGDCTMG